MVLVGFQFIHISKTSDNIRLDKQTWPTCFVTHSRFFFFVAARILGWTVWIKVGNSIAAALFNQLWDTVTLQI